MSVLLDRLLNLLVEEINLYESLFVVLQQEKKVVIASNLQGIRNIYKEKNNLLMKIQTLEKQRALILEEAADLFECPLKDLTLKKLSQIVKEPHSSRLMRIHADFAALMQRVQQINHANRALLAHTLNLVKGSLKLLNKLIAPSPIYYNTGKMQNNNRSGKFLSGTI